MPTETTPAEWGTIPDVAERLKVSNKTVRRLIERGELRAERIGPRLIRVDMTQIGGQSPDPDARAEEYIRRVVAEAPPLTDAQRDRLAALLRAGSEPARTLRRPRAVDERIADGAA